jgi:ferredoxin-NADP reductase
MDGEWCADSIFKAMRKPISPVTAGSTAPYLSTRWILTITGSAFWAATILLSASSEKTSPSSDLTSFVLAPIDGQPLPFFQSGQFVVLRLHLDPDKPAVLRSYSLSDLPVADHFRISVKSELNGIGCSFLCSRTREGDLLDVSAPRGSSTLRPSQNSAVLLSAGVGATPVMCSRNDAPITRRFCQPFQSRVWDACSCCRRAIFFQEEASTRLSAAEEQAQPQSDVAAHEHQ